MKKKIYLISFAVLALLTGWFIKHQTQSATFQPDTVWVKASKVYISNFKLEAHAIGTLTAQSVEISPEVAGHVEAILFKDGAAVQKGEALIQLDDAVYKAKYASAKAKLIYSENDYKRKALLGKQGAIAKQAIDQALADLKEKKAEADESAVMLNKMKLTAPFAGMLGKSKINPGNYVTVAEALVVLTDVKHLKVEYNVPEKYLPLVKLGQEIKISAAAFPDKFFTGKVSFISPTINPDNRSLSLYAEIENDSGKLAPGMFVNVTHALGTEQQTIIIPSRSLVPVLDGEQVYKVVDGKAHATDVTLGKRVEDNVQILKGLSPGDVIVTDGQLKVKDGMSVKIKT